MGIFTPSSDQPQDDGRSKEKKKSDSNLWHKDKTVLERDIAASYPGEPKDPKRREACEHDLERFLRTYFPRAFPSPFCRDHQKMIGKIQEAETQGGLYARAMPRGFGKTTIATRSMLHAGVYGHRRFGLLVASTKPLATRIMTQQKKELCFNKLLLEDFPEICYPFFRTKNDGRLARRQTWEGQPTGIQLSPDTLVFPTIPPSTVSGTILMSAALLGAIKGLFHELEDGTVIRPDFVLADDPQTRPSAKSITQTQSRIETIDGDILGLAGHDTPITVVMAVTPIFEGDLACHYLSRDEAPEWQGDTSPMVYRMPDALDTLWEQYRQTADEARRNDGDKKAATRFYLQNQEAMDAGAVLAWPDGPKSKRASVLQYAMDLYFRNRQAFFAEYQCRPESLTNASGLMLPPDQLAKRYSGLPMGMVPKGTDYLTAFVDAGKSYLFVAIGAWKKDFTGSIIEYGAWPQQRRRYYTKSDANPTIASYFATERPGLAGAAEETMLAAALDTLLPELLARTWTDADGNVFKLGRILCDAGDLGDVVRGAIVRLKQPKEKMPIVMPSLGIGIGASKKPMSARAKKDGDIVGYHWIAPEPRDRHELREVQIDTNAWKSFIHKRFFVDKLLPGSLTFYGDKSTDHTMWIDHLTAETPKEMENKSDDRKVVEWKDIPGHENEGLDCTSGAAVAASTVGAELTGAQEAPKRSGRKRKPINELMGGNQ